MGVGIRGTLEEKDPLNKVPFTRATSTVQKGPLQGVPLILPRTLTLNPAPKSLNKKPGTYRLLHCIIVFVLLDLWGRGRRLIRVGL